MNTYPVSMRYLFNRLAFGRNRVKQPIIAPTSAGPDSLLVFEIPANQKVDLSTVSIHFDASTSLTGEATDSVMLPRWTNCLIQTLSIDIGGVTVQQTDNYGHWQYLYNCYMAGDTKNARSIIEWGGVNTDGSSMRMSDIPLAFKSMLGLLSCGKVLDTGLTGAIRISIRLAPSSCLITKGAPTSVSYTLSNMSIQYDVVTLLDNLYDDLVHKRLQSGDVIPIVYNNYTSYLGNQSSSVDNASARFSVSTQSLDYIHATLLPATYSDVNQTYNTDTGTSTYFDKGSSQPITGVQLQLGGSYYPNYRPQLAEVYSFTSDALGISSDLLGSFDPSFSAKALSTAVTSTSTDRPLSKYNRNFFLASFRLCSGGSYDLGSALISGLDTRGNAQTISVQYYASGVGQSCIPLIWCQTSAILNIGAGKQLQLVL